MILFHRTTPAAAQAIQTHGFMDGMVRVGTGCARFGVVFADAPPREHLGVTGDALLTVDLASEDRHSLARYVQAELCPGSAATIYLLPAEFVNRRAVIVNVDVREPATW